TLEDAKIETREAYFEHPKGRVHTEGYNRALLPANEMIQGPAIVEEHAATTVLYRGQTVKLDGHGNLIIETRAREMMLNETKMDPFTLEIVKDSLLATGDEMFIALAKTSMSPIIYEVLDYASGLTDSKGQLLTQGNGVTGFIGMLSYMV